MSRVYINKEYKNFKTDAQKLFGSNNIFLSNEIDDSAFNFYAHRDGVQLIPKESGWVNGQYFGCCAKNNLIKDNVITSLGALQCIFSADGGHSGIIIADNILDTKGDHFVSVNGLFDGNIENNLDSRGDDVRVFLDNLKMGGNLEDSFWVTSFKSNHKYGEVACDSKKLEDMRGRVWRKNDNYRDNFNLTLFQMISKTIGYDIVDRFNSYNNIGHHFKKCLSIYKEYESYDNILVVDRFKSNNNTTISNIRLNGKFICHGLEDTYRDKKVWGKTRIPSGVYKVGLRTEGGFDQRYKRKFGDFHKGMLEIKNVPNYNWILFHIGNDHEDTAGCILTGNWKKGTNIVTSSEVTYKRFYNLLINLVLNDNLLIMVQDNDIK